MPTGAELLNVVVITNKIADESRAATKEEVERVLDATVRQLQVQQQAMAGAAYLGRIPGRVPQPVPIEPNTQTGAVNVFS